MQPIHTSLLCSCSSSRSSILNEWMDVLKCLVLTQEELSPVGLSLDVARDEDEVEHEEGARHERHHHDDSQGNVALDLPLLGVDGTS